MIGSPTPSGSFAAAIVALAVALLAGPVHAQLGVSARLEGMSPDLAGVVDDPLTDAAFNPARLGAFEQTQVYAGRLQRTNWILQFPGWGAYYPYTSILLAEAVPQSVVREDYPLTSAQPATMTWFAPVGADMTASFTADVASYGNDDARAATSFQPTTYPVDDGFTSETGARGSQTEFNDFRIDAALSSARGPDARAWGVRVTLEYKSFDDVDNDTNARVSWPQSDPSQLVLLQSLRKSSDKTHQMNADATVGVYRPGRALREVSMTGGAVTASRKHLLFRQEVSDEDEDGDGVDPDGGVPFYEYLVGDHASEREYTGGAVSGRAVLAHGDRVRSVHTVSYSALGGDGSAELFTAGLERSSGTNNGVTQELTYSYDGTVARFGAESAVGIVEGITDGLRVAAVVRGRYARDEFDDDASGDGTITISEPTGSGTFASGYRHDMSLVRQTQQLRVSLAGEWEVSRYLTIRTGVVYDAVRLESDATASREVTNPDVLSNVGYVVDSNNTIDYSTNTSFRTGLGVRLAERLFVDMYAGSLSYTAFSYGTVLFLF
jgi:hypothetical protein